MTADVVERIFKEFKFRTLSKTSSKNQIFKSIMNTAFKSNIICTEFGDDKNISYSINLELQPLLDDLYKICKNCAKTTLKIQPFIIDDEQIDCLEEN